MLIESDGAAVKRRELKLEKKVAPRFAPRANMTNISHDDKLTQLFSTNLLTLLTKTISLIRSQIRFVFNIARMFAYPHFLQTFRQLTSQDHSHAPGQVFFIQSLLHGNWACSLRYKQIVPKERSHSSATLAFPLPSPVQ